MLHIYPDFYKDFRCIADRCPDSCCKDWVVVVDPEAAARFEAVPGALGQKLRDVMETDRDGDLVFHMEAHGRCPFWAEDGLCDIQRHLGEAALCKTCAQFPRLTQDYGHFVEHGLTIGCPEAARLILNRQGPRQLTETEDQVPGEDRGLDAAFLEQLQAFRQTLLEELWEDGPEEVALARCLLHIQWFQDQLDGITDAAWDYTGAVTQLEQVRGMPMKRLLATHEGLELLSPQWGRWLQEGIRWTAPLPPWPESGMVRNLAEEYLYRYWLQGANDDDCVSRMVLLGVNFLVVRRLAQVHGDFSRDHLLKLFGCYAKEVEHDDQNREDLLDILSIQGLLDCRWVAREILNSLQSSVATAAGRK